MKIFDLQDSVSDGVSVDTLMELVPIDSGNATFGVATISAGTRHPAQDMSPHDQHEISYIIEGSMDLYTEEGTVAIKAGQVVMLEAGEKHATLAETDSKVFWALYG